MQQQGLRCSRVLLHIDIYTLLYSIVTLECLIDGGFEKKGVEGLVNSG